MTMVKVIDDRGDDDGDCDDDDCDKDEVDEDACDVDNNLWWTIVQISMMMISARGKSLNVHDCK